jgi:hypothetical protein
MGPAFEGDDLEVGAATARVRSGAHAGPVAAYDDQAFLGHGGTSYLPGA